MLLAWTGLQALGAWWSLHQDDVTYGRPRTAQYDVVVGHNDSASHPTHFIALNLHATVEVIELPGGDSSKAKIYRGPQLFGPGADLYPVTLSFPDPTGRWQAQHGDPCAGSDLCLSEPERAICPATVVTLTQERERHLSPHTLERKRMSQYAKEIKHLLATLNEQGDEDDAASS